LISWCDYYFSASTIDDLGRWTFGSNFTLHNFSIITLYSMISNRASLTRITKNQLFISEKSENLLLKNLNKWRETISRQKGHQEKFSRPAARAASFISKLSEDDVTPLIPILIPHALVAPLHNIVGL
jgi:hypothetical protein